jgi:hypothetical protein
LAQSEEVAILIQMLESAGAIRVIDSSSRPGVLGFPDQALRIAKAR